MGAIHRCTLYRGSPDACTNCRQPGHRHDVCPSPKTNLCPRCEHSIRNKTLLVRPNAFCVRALILPARDRARDETFTSQGNSQATQKRSSRNRPTQGQFSPIVHPDPHQPNQHKQAWTEPLKQAWNTPLSSHKHTTTMTVNPVYTRPDEIPGGGSGGQSRSYSSASRSRRSSACIAKLEAQISALATGSAISPTPAPTAPQPPPLNPPNDHALPSHYYPTSSADSLAMEADTEPSINSNSMHKRHLAPPPSH
ncbi:hypothetical protein HPB49_016458 [Dermacentor silvarum]|uniref:Uncharacterized protein n=1 Tax=Dermacentor silvarum TaxID=543639 RepID=A0ACB8CS35_DERSI|nr:hypothetical protein HPB49_016458 [Dermacentor silvarum]